MSLIYPNTCCCCDRALTQVEFHLCLSCDVDLPIILDDASVRNKFLGKLPFGESKALYHYEKENALHEILKEIKYKNNQDLAVFMGTRMANILLENNFATYDGIIPVPLHKSRLLQRGYNQSELLAKGMSDISGLPVLANFLQRKVATSTQTLKKRLERWVNVETVFEADDQVYNKKIILLDDVLTTGATLVACAESLIKKGSKEVSFLSLASAV